MFCYLILSVILNEMAEVHRKGLLKIAFFTFNRPHLLLDVIERRLQAKLSNDEEQAFLEYELAGVVEFGCFNPDNPLLDDEVKLKYA